MNSVSYIGVNNKLPAPPQEVYGIIPIYGQHLCTCIGNMLGGGGGGGVGAYKYVLHFDVPVDDPL